MPSPSLHSTIMSFIDSLLLKVKAPEPATTPTPQLRPTSEIERLKLRREVLRNLDPERMEHCLDTWYGAHVQTEALLPQLKARFGELRTNPSEEEGPEGLSETETETLIELWSMVGPPLNSAPPRLTSDGYIDSAFPSIPSPSVEEEPRLQQFSEEQRTPTTIAAENTPKSQSPHKDPTHKSPSDASSFSTAVASPTSTTEHAPSPQRSLLEGDKLLSSTSKPRPLSDANTGKMSLPDVGSNPRVGGLHAIPPEANAVVKPTEVDTFSTSGRSTRSKSSAKSKAPPNLKIDTSLRPYAPHTTVLDGEITPRPLPVARRSSHSRSKKSRRSASSTVTSEATTSRKSTKGPSEPRSKTSHKHSKSRSSQQTPHRSSSSSTISRASSIRTYKRRGVTIEIEEYTLDLSIYSQHDWEYLQRQESLPGLCSRGSQVNEVMTKNTDAEYGRYSEALLTGSTCR